MRIFLQRRRKVLVRVGALMAVGFGTLVAVLPRADAHDHRPTWSGDPRSVLLSPQRLSSAYFATFQPSTQG